MKKSNIKFAFFGTPRRGVTILNKLKENGLVPSLVITGMDTPKGRGLKITPPEVKVWAIENSIPFLQPKELEDTAFKEAICKESWDLFVVVSFGKIIPNWLLQVPKKGCINLHFSLLPKYRGATPAEAAILNGDTVTGVSVVLMDDKLDHGPIIAQEEYQMPEKLPTSFELVESLSEIGGRLLSDAIPDFFSGKIVPKEQDHAKAVLCGKIKKEDGLIDLTASPLQNFRKIQAYREWPKPYFFVLKNGKKIRVIIRDAKYENGKLEILRVIPEGKKEISYSDFQKQLI